MANWIIQNCLDPTDTKIVNDKKDSLQKGSVLVAGTPGPSGEITGCYSALEETVQFQNYQIFGESLDCVECLVNNNFKLIFRNCSTEIDYYVSPQGFDKLPTIGSVYGGVISEVGGCFTFFGVTDSDENLSVITIGSEFNSCLECQGGFAVTFEQEILINNTYNLNDVSVLNKTGDFLEPFEYFISEQNKVKDVIIEKGSNLKVGNSSGTLGIMVVDSNNFSATTTTEVLKRIPFTTNRDEIINNVNYQDFKQKNIKDNYNSIIQNRINPQSQDQAK